MSITIHLAPETQRKLEACAAQAGQSLERYLEQLAERAAGTSGTPPAGQSGESLAGPRDTGEDAFAAVDAELRNRFRTLVRRWQKETSHFSSAARMAAHPAYQEIIGMGWKAVPLLLAELRRRPDFWFAALREITKENPVPQASAGKMQEMARAWIKWGKAKGYIQ